jgi:hypothetical protein
MRDRSFLGSRTRIPILKSLFIEIPVDFMS